MTAADVTDRLEVHDPNVEVVLLTATDGETYVSKKFGKIRAVQVSANSDVDAYLNASWSGGTVTINWVGQTDKVCTLTIYGTR